MKRTGRTLPAWAALAALALAWTASPAQDASPARSAELTQVAKYNKEVFDRLVGQMAELAQLMDKTDPDAARALREALKVAQHADISTDMSKVADFLDKAMPSHAAQSEMEVIRNLHAVLDALHRKPQDQQRPYRETIEKMLAEILEAQRGISTDTKASHEKLGAGGDADGAALRSVELKLTVGLAEGQGALAARVQEVLNLLKSDGTTVVFPYVLEVVKKDMLDVQQRLARKDGGAFTQAVQADIERSLEELLKAIRGDKGDRPEKRKGQRGDPPIGDPRAPIVPLIAELKVLRILQIEINGRTNLLDSQAKQKALPADQVRRQARELSERESNVKKLTEALTSRVTAP